MRILIVEDDEALARFVRQGLEGEHYAVDVAGDGEQARAAAVEGEYDVVILDLNLPTLDGVSVLRHLRLKKPSQPVLVLTQRSRVEDRVQCLDTGADDYLAKPFSFNELSARIRALLRRSHLPSESVLTVGDLKMDRVQRVVERAGRRIELTAKEFSLLEYLMRHAGRSVTRSMIIEHVWNLTFDTTTNVVDVYINYTVLMEGDDEKDPLVDGARALLDGHIMLDRKLAVRSHYPPIAVLDSISRLMPAVCSPEHVQKAHELRRLLAAYAASEDLIRIGAYQKGSDPTLDKALALIPELHRFLMQKPGDKVSFSDSVAKLLALPS